MTKEEIMLVKNSWKMLRNVSPQVIGDVFYSKLFFDAPQLKAMFHQPLASQSEKLFGMLSVIISRLDSFDTLKDDIRKLALRHKAYGVKTVHYDLVGNALLWTLEKAFGADWNEELAKAWLKCYTTLATTMLISERQERTV